MNDNFFKISFIATIVLMAIIFSSNLEGPHQASPPISLDQATVAPQETAPGTEKISGEAMRRLRRRISEGSLADKEAMFYQAIDKN